MKKNKSFEIGVVLALIVLSLILFGITLIIDYISQRNKFTLFINPYTILECNKYKCENVSDNLEDYNKKNYNIVLNSINQGNYKLEYDNLTKEFSLSNNTRYDNTDNLLAYSGKVEISPKHYSINDMSIDEIRLINENSDLNITSNDLLYAKSIKMDYDNDGNLETLYYLKSQVIDLEVYFTLLVYNDENDIYILDSETSSDVINIDVNKVNNIVDIYNDKTIEFIYSKEFFSEAGHCNILFRIKNNKFIKVNECELVK